MRTDDVISVSLLSLVHHIVCMSSSDLYTAWGSSLLWNVAQRELLPNVVGCMGNYQWMTWLNFYSDSVLFLFVVHPPILGRQEVRYLEANNGIAIGHILLLEELPNRARSM